MPHPLLKALCLHCRGVTLLDPPLSSQQPSRSTPPFFTPLFATVPSPAYRCTHCCTHCGELLYLNDRYTLVEALGQRSFLALDWQRTSHGDFLQGEYPSPCVVQREFPPRSMGEPILRRLLSLPPHPQFPQVQGYFEHGGLGYLVQDYCPGQALTQWTARGDGVALPVGIVARVVETLLSLLSEIHAQGLIHGDVKPANILVGHPETWLVKAGHSKSLKELRLVDWGNAQEPATPLPPWLTSNQNVCSANAEYAAPEQLAGQPHFASDFYSVGVVGIQLLTGMAPFHWLDQEDHWRLLYRNHREEQLLNLSPELDLSADREVELCDQLDRLLHPDPDQRYPHQGCTDRRYADQPYADRRYTDRPYSLPHANRSSPVLTASVQWQLQGTLSGASGHTAAVKALASPAFKGLSPDKLQLPPWFMSAGDDRTLRLWNFETGELLATATVTHKPIQVLCSDPNSSHRWVSGSTDGLLRWWQIQTTPEQTLELVPLVNCDRHHQGSINALVFITSQILASAGADKTIYLWQTAPLDHLEDTPPAPAPIATLSGHRLAIQALAVAPQHQHLASGSGDGTVKIWDLNRHSLITTLKGHTAAVKTVAFSPDGQSLASAGNDRTIQLWDTQNWTIQSTLPGHGWPITQLKFTDPQTLWSSSWDSTLKCWDLSGLLRGEKQELGQPIAHLQGHTDAVTCFILLGDRMLISGSADYGIKIWRSSGLGGTQ
jgi:WD40 repeat protein